MPEVVLRSLVRALGTLETQGWTCTDSLRSVGIKSPVVSSSDQLIAQITDLQPGIAQARLSLWKGPNRFVLTSSNANWSISTAETPDLDGTFEGGELSLAQRAADGVSEAALQLRGDWTLEASVDLAKPLRVSTQDFNLHALRSLTVLEEALKRTGWWELKDLLRASDKPTAFLVDEDGTELSAGSVSVASSLALIRFAQINVGDRRKILKSATGTSHDQWLLPEEIAPERVSGSAAAVGDLLLGMAGALAFAVLATTVRLGDSTELEFFGYKRSIYSVAPRGMDDVNRAQEAIDLYSWVASSDSPDRTLALRQVMSLQAGDLISQVSGVDARRAAEPIYRALRSSAIAEIVSARRAAWTAGIDASRKAIDATTSISKSVVDRFIAAFIALAGTAIAKSTERLAPADAQAISLSVAGFLAALGLWFLVADLPTLGAPVKHLSSDLGPVAGLLSSAELDEITQSGAVRFAETRVKIVKLLVPLAYGIAAIAALLVANVLGRR